jgi:hypothetical protein
MDANHYTPVGVVSPAAGFTQPEILQEAKQGVIDADLPVDRQRVADLLGGRLPARDAQQEAYRLLLVASCNRLHGAMPYLFEPIADYTELLLPDDLLSEASILHAVRETLSEAVCQDEEVIGWLYQFYIAEKKEAVDAKVKAGGKVEADELPAKTSLYTPDWIVRFLVDNSLGRLWMANRPQSQLAKRMAYYIRPEQGTPNFVRVTSPEELRVGDSAAGSAHMLLYAFELLYAMYEEEGYNPPDIARLILEKNLYGMEIDARAAALAAFALTMKARRYDRRFLRRGVRPHICVLHSVRITAQELVTTPWLAKLGATLTDLPVRDALLHDLEAATLLDNVGSLLRPQLTLAQIARVREVIGAADDLFTHGFNERVLDVLAQVEYLARRHHVVVANPPYLGKGMNEELSDFAKQEYPDSKADMFAMFIERNLELAKQGGLVAMITMQSWMFLSSYEKLRGKLLDHETLLTMAHLGAKAFDSIGGEVVSTTAFVVEHAHRPDYNGSYVRLVDGNSEAEKEAALRAALTTPLAPRDSPLHRASAADFKKIPGAPIAYWVSRKFSAVVEVATSLESLATLKEGLTTGNNDLFLRYWYEVATDQLGIAMTSQLSALESGRRWFPYNKGGSFRRWYGNNDYVVDWFDSGRRIHDYAGVPLDFGGAPVRAKRYYFDAGITWTRVSSASSAFRLFDKGFIFDSTGPSIFPESADAYVLTCALNSKPTRVFLELVAPTLDFRLGPVGRTPILETFLDDDTISTTGQRCVAITKSDWDAYETSWDFTTLPLLRPAHRQATLAATYAHLRRHWQQMTDEMQRLETENNRIFIDAYGLQDELTADVLLHEITLTCNPHYRYGAGKSDDEYARLLLADTLREFVSYAVGCMFGRYSLEKAGLVLANAGETVEDYAWKVGRLEIGDWRLEIGEERATEPNLQSPNLQSPTLPISFPPDRDNVIPILDGEWFADDIVERCKRFLRVTFGEEHYAENLAFVEQGLGRDLRGYFLREFYDDHVRRYQKRPIYWLFSSPKGSFNALIYMHRYRPDTVSVVLNDYLRDFQNKLAAHRSHLERVSISAASSPRDKTAALKEIDKVEKMIAELAEYERDVLYPLATQQVAIDLDDGVKVNYAKFGKALRRIVGVSG